MATVNDGNCNNLRRFITNSLVENARYFLKVNASCFDHEPNFAISFYFLFPSIGAFNLFLLNARSESFLQQRASGCDRIFLIRTSRDNDDEVVIESHRALCDLFAICSRSVCNESFVRIVG